MLSRLFTCGNRPHPLAQVGHELLLAQQRGLDFPQLCLGRLSRSGLCGQRCSVSQRSP